MPFSPTTEPMTAQGQRKGESSSASMRNGFRAQPARLVRGSSRRIMSMRFRPANIRVINRRASSSAVIGPAVRTEMLKAHQQERVPATPPVEGTRRCQNGARRQGFASPRPTPARPCLLRAVPANSSMRRRAAPAGTLRGLLVHSKRKGRLPSLQRKAGLAQKTCQTSQGLTGSLHIRTTASERTGSAATAWRCWLPVPPRN
jgi:hypothetical protein